MTALGAVVTLGCATGAPASPQQIGSVTASVIRSPVVEGVPPTGSIASSGTGPFADPGVAGGAKLITVASPSPEVPAVGSPAPVSPVPSGAKSPESGSGSAKPGADAKTDAAPLQRNGDHAKPGQLVTEADRAEVAELRKHIAALNSRLAQLDAKVNGGTPPASADPGPGGTGPNIVNFPGGNAGAGSGSAVKPPATPDKAGIRYRADNDYQGGGFSFQTDDGKFRLNVEGRAQLRYTYYNQTDEGIINGEKDKLGTNRDLRSDFGIPRFRLNFTGHTLTRDLTYQLELDASTNRRAAGDSGGSAAGELASIQNAWVNYNALASVDGVPEFFKDAVQLRAGTYQQPFGRSGVVSAWARQSEVDTQTVDRMFADQYFRWDRATGVDIHGVLGGVVGDLPADRPGTKGFMEYFLCINNGPQSSSQRYGIDSGATGTAGRGLDKYPAFLARVNFDILKGRYIGADGLDYYWFGKSVGDFEHHETPALQAGGTFGWIRYRDQNALGDNTALGFFPRPTQRKEPLPVYNKQGKITGYKESGDPMPLDNPGSDITRVGADFAFKWKGFSVQSELYWQNLRGINDNPLRFPNQSNDTFGWYVSGGWFVVPRTWEIVAGASGLYAGTRPKVFSSKIAGADGEDPADAHQFTLGTNWFPFSNQKVRLSLDGSYLPNMPISAANPGYQQAGNEDAFQIRAQVQFGF